MSRVLISANAGWNIVNFRSGLVRALIADGHAVIAAIPDDDAVPAVRALGARTIVLPIARGGVSVIGDLILVARFALIMQAERPDIVLSWTIKPNVYGAFAAALFGIPAIANISGLGTAFIRSNWLTILVKGLYRIGLGRAALVFFQNEDDCALFVGFGLVRPAHCTVLPGSGIDVAAFDPTAYPPKTDDVFRFLLIARLIRDKGVHEFVDAARSLASQHPGAVFEILGPIDPDNHTAIASATLQRWIDDGAIRYLGSADDVRPAIARADCIVLPSYREGTSRVLLEAAAMARPAIATDVPGCRDVIVDGVTGLLCRVRDAGDLAAKMTTMLDMTTAARVAMGAAARADVARRFAESLIITAYRAAIAKALQDKHIQ